MANEVIAPNTVVQLSHAMTIRVSGMVVGAINEWNPRMTKTVTELYEFGAVTDYGGKQSVSGSPFSKVPGNVSGMEMEVKRYDLYTMQMEQAFGLILGAEVNQMLSNQLEPFDVQEVWTVPSNRGTRYQNNYEGCWFTNLGRTISTTGDRTINVSATLSYTLKTKFTIA